MTTEATSRAYSTPSATSINAPLTTFLVGTASEKRLARTLLLLARFGNPMSHRALPRVSQETLAEMVGTTRSRVNFFMNKFRKLGFIEYNGSLKINNSLLGVVLRD